MLSFICSDGGMAVGGVDSFGGEGNGFSGKVFGKAGAPTNCSLWEGAA